MKQETNMQGSRKRATTKNKETHNRQHKETKLQPKEASEARRRQELNQSHVTNLHVTADANNTSKQAPPSKREHEIAYPSEETRP